MYATEATTSGAFLTRHLYILKKGWRILKNHMLIHDKARIDNIFTCAILHNMLIEHDKWANDDDDDDIAADIPELSMDERIINI